MRTGMRTEKGWGEGMKMKERSSKQCWQWTAEKLWLWPPKKSKYQETNNLCVNEVSVSYINMLFFLNKWKKSCANQSMLVYIVWLQPCKNYTSSQSIVSICNKKNMSCIWFPLCTNGINIYRAAYLNEPLLSMKTFISLRLGKIKAVFQT